MYCYIFPLKMYSSSRGSLEKCTATFFPSKCTGTFRAVPTDFAGICGCRHSNLVDVYEYASRSYLVDAYEYASCSYIVDAYEYASHSYLVLWGIKR